MNVALRLISLSPPAFQRSSSRPAPKPSASLLSPEGQPQTIQPQIPILSPLCFHGLTNCFSRKPFIFKNICVAPRVCPLKTLLRRTTTSTCRPHEPIPFIIKRLRTLVLSCSSFSRSHPLFSIACRLFVQKQGGGVPLRVSLCSPLSALCVSVFPGRLCATQRSLRLSVILWIFRCLGGESESPALSFPSFGGPKNADAR